MKYNERVLAGQNLARAGACAGEAASGPTSCLDVLLRSIPMTFPGLGAGPMVGPGRSTFCPAIVANQFALGDGCLLVGTEPVFPESLSSLFVGWARPRGEEYGIEDLLRRAGSAGIVRTRYGCGPPPMQCAVMAGLAALLPLRLRSQPCAHLGILRRMQCAGGQPWCRPPARNAAMSAVPARVIVTRSSCSNALSSRTSAVSPPAARA